MTHSDHATHFFTRVHLRLRDDGLPDAGAADWQMGPGEALRRIAQIGECLQHPDLKALGAVLVPTPLHLFGGEPFSHPGDLEQVLASAAQYQMFAEVTTRASWIEDRVQIRRMLERFVGKIFAIVISLTRRSVDAIGLDRIEMLLEESKLLGIGSSIKCPIGPGSPFPREILALEALNSRSGFISIVPDLALLENARSSPEARRYLLPEPPFHRRCAELFEFVVIAGGDCFPCIPGAGVPGLCLGSLERESPIEILKRTMTDPRYVRLWNEGPFHIFESVRNSAAGQGLYEGYADACDFHRQSLLDPRMAPIATRLEFPAPPSYDPRLLGGLPA